MLLLLLLLLLLLVDKGIRACSTSSCLSRQETSAPPRAYVGAVRASAPWHARPPARRSLPTPACLPVKPLPKTARRHLSASAVMRIIALRAHCTIIITVCRLRPSLWVLALRMCLCFPCVCVDVDGGAEGETTRLHGQARCTGVRPGLLLLLLPLIIIIIIITKTHRSKLHPSAAELERFGCCWFHQRSVQAVLCPARLPLSGSHYSHRLRRQTWRVQGCRTPPASVALPSANTVATTAGGSRLVALPIRTLPHDQHLSLTMESHDGMTCCYSAGPVNPPILPHLSCTTVHTRYSSLWAVDSANSAAATAESLASRV
ncbi:hypothetical protein CERZMDRAFT_82222 [Cercospora zeae-maydis SCOH1-5]|uniref:Secreted protein n=1 Tax=Cercospora zeae-maydis SCOH1-5 TaxID=717836 RepID=A0A6A6FNX5_9PEZI|nr:hypothetical protein CERZMDRAFT_82222 [Cercospora zeae-maydis SCOH1-5]